MNFVQKLKLLLKEEIQMVDMYVALIIAERRTLSQVPVTFRNAVGKDLEALGLDGIGKPILSV
ncbi:CD1375 family protein [Peribacillus sp. NPDC097224]|uniref:CD1375 family protein n=1 Tax=Peribacillus sp. NPDC097224 TaxID=3364399 RepID=UPI003806FD02